ncbi:hypothetical protein E2562_016161 [Oryza meyeriana var. granulata]|uniref:Uncharacterized protein n=1 Tax=Oryza meyeriana var. granulata TaxID=110450 RepID=A0A6G1F8G8_9ORYZ|nr:hypothetical protein E2562_016161 [Oryza meyeriana var. granulata]
MDVYERDAATAGGEGYRRCPRDTASGNEKKFLLATMGAEAVSSNDKVTPFVVDCEMQLFQKGKQWKRHGIGFQDIKFT